MSAMSHSFERDLGQFEARIAALEADMQEIRRDVREIRDALVGARGGWKLLTLVIGLSASLGAVLGKWLPVFLGARG